MAGERVKVVSKEPFPTVELAVINLVGVEAETTVDAEKTTSFEADTIVDVVDMTGVDPDTTGVDAQTPDDVADTSVIVTDTTVEVADTLSTPIIG